MSPSPSRVLVANLNPIASVGMTELLSRDGYEIIKAGPDVVRSAIDGHPDAVVVGLDGPAGRALGWLVRDAAPAATVILWDNDERGIEVLGPGASDPRRPDRPAPAALLTELATLQRNRDRE